MKYDTALREHARRRIREIGSADLVVGVPCYNAEASVDHVVRTIARGLAEHYPNSTAVIVVSDGGSLDYTREAARAVAVEPPIHRIVTIYRGLPGKGTSLRAVFEAATRLQAKACAVFDSDLQSITPKWVPALLQPALELGYDFVSPFYVRHKWDATITNNIARALTQALYAKRIRQPIGGDFGFSARLVEWFTRADVWDGDIARFGIDIWMTTVAICEGFQVCEAFLGAKVHDPKDPSASLGPMFRQVVGTLFGMMARYESVWRNAPRSTTVPLLGQRVDVEPPEVRISLERLTESYRAGFEHFASLWREVLAPEQFALLERLSRAADADFHMEARSWARIVYDFVATFHRWSKDRYKLVETMTPIYYARVAAFVVETRDLTTAEADLQVDRQAETFEEEKPYLVERMATAARPTTR
ncbi:MAG: glycosyltransferase [Planctomycetes bacterium]|nr:glycosyltransferase [Planctomycetota bacterium]MBI3843735.1 glycosyltransferase [Planctomycetota bacterium]